MKEFAVFWGCTIPARFPFIEKSTRMILADLGAEVHELEGHTCCPEGVLVKANDEDMFYTVAARNLALVEGADLSVVTPCNGCYSTFKEASNHLAKDWRHKDAINEKLATQGLHYSGTLGIEHFAEWLSEDVGAGAIASKMVKPLWGMRIAVHYGCHLLRPQPAVRWDDPLHPTKVEALVSALGARVVDYTTKMQCCGGALDRVGERDSALAFCRRKLADLQQEEVDALVVVCPSCFQQFDLNQAALQRANEGFDIPVFYLSELIGLTYGHTAEEMGMDMHRVSVQPFLDAWEGRLEDRRAVAEFFEVSELAKCAACGACREDCPVCQVDPTFQPTEIIAMLADGRIGDVLADDNLWKCVECFTCNELCHSRFGMAEVFRKLKEISVEQGTGKPQVAEAYATFLKTGSLGEPRESARKKLGLEPLPTRGKDAVNALLTCEQKKQEACDAEL